MSTYLECLSSIHLSNLFCFKVIKAGSYFHNLCQQISEEKPHARTSFHMSGGISAYINMAQQTRSRKSKRLSSAKRESQMRITSGNRNSWESSNVSQRKAKNWGLMFCSCCWKERGEALLSTSPQCRIKVCVVVGGRCTEM